MNKSMQLTIAVVVVVGLSVATGLMVHHNDDTNNAHAMMMSDAMQKTAIKKAETSAAMKQKQSDEMTDHDTMMSSTAK
jgi:hypothetical protein